ncbi:MAG: glycoside hydrolase family 25 protein [Myxococcales bacterium]|nr:glycoside hydrolase family 25 protein [Myxococcales bacterium]
MKRPLRNARTAALVVGVSGALFASSACDPEMPDDQIMSQFYGVTVCPKGPVLEGIDISHWQGSIDWAKVKAGGKHFAIMKATEGTGYTDPTFKGHWGAAKANGVVRGAYHFFRANIDPVQQADHFLSVAGAPGAGDLPLVADVETADGQSGAVISQRVLAFLVRLEQKSGRVPMIYTSPGFFGGTMGNPKGFEKYHLWVAHWQVNCPNVPGSWTNWPFWQYTSKGTVPGIAGNVDLDRFNGSLNDLMTFAGNGPCKPNCGGKVCGPDGCNGSCGACAMGKTCTSGQCVCAPACMGKMCGDNGCGGSCGMCGANQSCANGQCVNGCKPDCTGKACGPDGCNGSCGACAMGESCQDGQCAGGCQPDCAGRVCGDDGCTGTCGACGPNLNCANGKCVAGACTPNCTNRLCGSDGCSGRCGTPCTVGKACDESGHCVPSLVGDGGASPDAAGGPPGDATGGCTCAMGAGARGADPSSPWRGTLLVALVIALRRRGARLRRQA